MLQRLRGDEDSAELAGQFFEHVPTAFAIYDANGRCVALNRARTELFGTQFTSDHGRFPDTEQAESIRVNAITRALAGEVVHVPPFWLQAPVCEPAPVATRTRVALELTAFPLPRPRDAIGHVAVALRDVTADTERNVQAVRAQADAVQVSANRSRSGQGTVFRVTLAAFGEVKRQVAVTAPSLPVAPPGVAASWLSTTNLPLAA
jgi:hypothetical protein